MAMNGEPFAAREVRSRLPRLTQKIFVDLGLWMVGLGLLAGLAFPFAVIPLGVPAALSLTFRFFAGALLAGLCVGSASFFLTRSVVGKPISQASERMHFVADALTEATYSGNWDKCSPETCRLEINSSDELGDMATSFNLLLDSLSDSRSAESAMRSLTAALAEHLLLDGLAMATLEEFLRHSGAAAGVLCVIKEGELLEAANVGLSGLEVGTSLDRDLRSDAVRIIDLPQNLLVQGIVTSFKPRQVLVVPFRFKSFAVGAVVLAFAHQVDQRIVRLVNNLRDPVGLALTNSLTHERFQLLAAVDPLTGSYNRRFGYERLDEEFARSIRSGSPLGLLSFDVDHFKAINDTHGHLAGDRVLSEVSRVAQVAIRQGDILVRTGGEEFLVVLPGAGEHDVREIGERIRRVIEATTVAAGAEHVAVTISLGGLSSADVSASNSLDLLAQVDEALYVSKATGRNRLTMVQLPQTSLAPGKVPAAASISK